MRAIAGAIVILAGWILGGSATMASATERAGAAALAGLIGGLLLFLGLCLLLFGWDRADRLPKWEPPGRPPDARP